MIIQSLLFLNRLINRHKKEKMGCNKGEARAANNVFTLRLMFRRFPPTRESPICFALFDFIIEVFCTSLDLGTCWLGGSFRRSDFKKQIPLKPNEKLRIVSPVGYARDGKSFIRYFMDTVVDSFSAHVFRQAQQPSVPLGTKKSAKHE